MIAFQELESRASKLLRESGLESPPVDLVALAKKLRVTVEQQDLGASVSGLVVRGPDGRVVIGVNASHHPNRQRFTIAHEIGHHLLHKGSATVFVDNHMVHFRDDDRTPGADPREVEANAFAAALLMPEPWLRKDLRRESRDLSDDATVRTLATRYQVSQQALTFRLVNLHLLSGLSSRRDRLPRRKRP